MKNSQDLPDLAELGSIPDPYGGFDERPPVPRPTMVEDAPARTTVRARRVAALAVSLTWLGAHLAVYGIRADLLSLPPLYAATQILVPFAFAIASILVATSSGKLGLGASISAVLSLAVLGPASFWLIALGAPVPHATARGGSFWLGALVCLDITLSWAAVPLLVSAWSLRRSFPVASRPRAALIGAACGLFSGAVMNLHCPSVDPFHIALGHGVPVLIAVTVGALLLSRWVRI